MEDSRRRRSPRGSEGSALRDRSLAWWCSVNKGIGWDRTGAGLESPKYRARRGLFPSSGETALSPVHRGGRTMRSRKRPRMSKIRFPRAKSRVPQSSVGFNGNSMVGCITGGVRGCALSAIKTPGPLLSCRALSTRNGRPEDTSAGVCWNLLFDASEGRRALYAAWSTGCTPGNTRGTGRRTRQRQMPGPGCRQARH